LTKRLFYKNPYIKDFTASITKITEKNNKFHIELNQTAFFPEGGGQPSDQGYIDDVPVFYVYEEDERIFHVLEKLPSKLENVKCIIDWEKRFDHMQQHLGQHILSSAFEKLHDAETVGFHLGSEYVTIDINIPLSKDDIDNVEYYANQIVFNDLVVECIYPSSNELENLPLRKQPKVTENIRIVKIDDFDYSPCCGTHPNRSGEVGLIKIKKYENYKGGMRIVFLCGNRALKDYCLKNNIINEASSILSVKDYEVTNAVKKISNELINIKKENNSLKEQLIEYEAEHMLNNAQEHNNIKIIAHIFEDREFNEVKLLSSKITSAPKSVVVFGIKSDDKAQLILSRSKEVSQINMNEVLKESILLIDGKGGGTPFTAQGGGKEVSKLDEAIKYAYTKIKQVIK
jgi:alanyl-tRNA synthetase